MSHQIYLRYHWVNDRLVLLCASVDIVKDASCEPAQLFFELFEVVLTDCS